VQLLVSVSDASEARAALVGGASILDAKDPLRGPLGAVAGETLDEIVAVAANARAVSAALGDAHSESAVAAAARSAARAGAAIVKLGFRGTTSEARVVAFAAAAVRGAAPFGTRVVLVAYADAARARTIPAQRMAEVASQARAAGVLLDTAFKDGADLFTHLSPDEVVPLVARAHQLGLLVSLAGSLDARGVSLARTLGADVAGVRGAACDGGRTGRVSSERVRALLAAARGVSADELPLDLLSDLSPSRILGLGEERAQASRAS
jgi:uncharacterized protein (UPF0264 family)